MQDKKGKFEAKRVDTKEFELPDITYEVDIDTFVFQGIILKCLARVEGVELVAGNFIDNILGRTESAKGIFVEQDPKAHSISVRIELNVAYGISIPAKADEIHTLVEKELTRLTGLRVAKIQVDFKALIPNHDNASQKGKTASRQPDVMPPGSDEYGDIF